MRSLSGPTLTALAAGTVPMVALVRLGFSVPILLNSSTWDFTYASEVYKGAGALGAISTIDDSPGEVKGLSLQLIGVDSSYISLALDGSDVVQGTPIVIRTAILDSNYAIVDAPVEWTGKLDTMTIEEDGETCTIGASAESSAVDLLKGSALTYSNADHQSLYPGDLAFQYVASQTATPITWPSKLWQILLSGYQR